jgi:transketolase
MNTDDIQKLKKKSYEMRQQLLDICAQAGTGHFTSSLSCTDILVSLYYGGLLRHDPARPEWSERDRFVLSKGQASPILYAILADRGFFDPSWLDRFAQKDGAFGVHLQDSVPGVECTSGSLGHGFGLAAGIALAARMDGDDFRVFALLGDGECYEGSIWESAMFASHHGLTNLTAIVDRNALCVTDFTENIVALEPLEERWQSFGWDVRRINGHDHEDLVDALAPRPASSSSRPLVVIADTVKGEGIDFISNIPLWHARAPQGDEIEQARAALERRYADA